MAKSVLVLAGSPRRRGNSALLADAFIRGAQEAGCETEMIHLQGKKLGGCFGCNACQKNGGVCVQKDDMAEIYEKWLAADAVVLATPVYFYTWSAQIKAVIDRSFAIEKRVQDTAFYLLAAGAAPSEDYMGLLRESFEKYVGCFRAGGNRIGGCAFGTSAAQAGDVNGTAAIEQAYALGRRL